MNKIIYNKLLLQAEEAKNQDMIKLSSAIVGALYSSDSELKVYTYSELKSDIHQDLWKIATRLITYYDLNSVDATKMDETIIHLASKTLDELENTLDVEYVLAGPLEPKVPGETEWYDIY